MAAPLETCPPTLSSSLVPGAVDQGLAGPWPDGWTGSCQTQCLAIPLCPALASDVHSPAFQNCLVGTPAITGGTTNTTSPTICTCHAPAGSVTATWAICHFGPI
jgi:hypothetical protein